MARERRHSLCVLLFRRIVLKHGRLRPSWWTRPLLENKGAGARPRDVFLCFGRLIVGSYLSTSVLRWRGMLTERPLVCGAVQGFSDLWSPSLPTACGPLPKTDLDSSRGGTTSRGTAQAPCIALLLLAMARATLETELRMAGVLDAARLAAPELTAAEAALRADEARSSAHSLGQHWAPGQSIVFLDVDGVLNTSMSWPADGAADLTASPLEGRLCASFARLLQAASAHFVLSSSWRRRPALKVRLLRELEQHGVPWERCVGETPVFAPGRGRKRMRPGALAGPFALRPAEIYAWLESHPTTRWVALDDHALGMGRSLLVDAQSGLQDRDCDQALAVLAGGDAPLET